uniref:Uncharacterized protein n=1 Tax=Phasianus colchicus TaxID=9054 RepID=A0A669QSQ0_PHACC
MELRTERAWNGLPISHNPITIALKSYDTGTLMHVSAPIFNDPQAPEKPFRKLWDYKFAEAFVLSDRTEQHLEVELCKYSVLKMR